MLAQITEVARKALLVGSMVWGAANWTYFGPELGSRSIRADGHLEPCKTGYGQSVQASIAEEIEAIPAPRLDMQKEMAVRQLRSFQNSPFGAFMRQAPMMGVDVDDVIDTYNTQKRAAQEEYQQIVAAIKEKTTRKLG